jgi:hypothetical protein
MLLWVLLVGRTWRTDHNSNITKYSQHIQPTFMFWGSQRGNGKGVEHEMALIAETPQKLFQGGADVSCLSSIFCTAFFSTHVLLMV